MKYFYSHLVEIESIVVALDSLDLADHEKKHLAQLVDSTLHNSVMDAILSQLKESDKELFLKKLRDDDHQQIWDFLDARTLRIEDTIKKTVQDLKKELHVDIEEAKKTKGD